MQKHHTFLAGLVAVILISPSRAEEPTSESAEDFIQDWVATINLNEPGRLLAFYDHSEETEVIVSSGLQHRGYQALENVYKDEFKHVRFHDSTAREMRTRILGDTALITFEHLFKIQVLSDDSRWQIHILTTSVLYRLENEWKIVLEHSSPIRGVERMTRIED